MGKKSRSKKFTKDNEKSNRFKKDLLTMASNLVHMCMQSVDRQDEWTFFVSLHKAVELFQKKQKQAQDSTTKLNRSDASKTFLEWLHENGATYAKIEMKEISEEEGFGFIATEDIKTNELLTQVPDKVILKFSDAQNSYLGQLIERHDMLTMMPNVSLALFLHCEKYNNDSFFKPYLDMLPTEFNTTLYFSPSELEYLKGSATLGNAIHQYKAIVRQFGILFQTLNTGVIGNNAAMSECVKHIPSAAIESFDFDAYRWAVSVVTTRQNKLPSCCEESSCCSEKNSSLALVPLWDMFNHSIGPMTTQYNSETKTIECVAMKEFKKGEQVTICYGSRPNYELLVHNGFVMIDNPYDKMRIPLGISSKDPLFEKRSALLSRFTIDKCSYFTIGMMDNHLVASPLVAFLRIFHMDSDELDIWLQAEANEIGILQQVLIGSDQNSQFKSDEQMWAFLEIRLNLLIHGTQKVVKSSQLDRSLSARAKLCVAIRMEEMKVLQSCLQFCKQTKLLLNRGILQNLQELSLKNGEGAVKLPKIEEQEGEKDEALQAEESCDTNHGDNENICDKIIEDNKLDSMGDGIVDTKDDVTTKAVDCKEDDVNDKSCCQLKQLNEE